MPYNNTAIPPPEETTGQSSLPSSWTFPDNLSPGTVLTDRPPYSVTRIKKIIRLDEDIVQCSNNAAFVISVATVRSPSLIAAPVYRALRATAYDLDRRCLFSTWQSKGIKSRDRRRSRGRIYSTEIWVGCPLGRGAVQSGILLIASASYRCIPHR